MGSGFLSLNWADLGKGILVAFGTVFLGALYGTLNSGTFPTGADLKTWALAGLAAAVSYLLKNLFTNSSNQLAKPEPPK